jgi:hypothetical protein
MRGWGVLFDGPPELGALGALGLMALLGRLRQVVLGAKAHQVFWLVCATKVVWLYVIDVGAAARAALTVLYPLTATAGAADGRPTAFVPICGESCFSIGIAPAVVPAFTRHRGG